MLPVFESGDVTRILPDAEDCAQVKSVVPTIMVPVVVITHDVEPLAVPLVIKFAAPV